MSYDGTWQLSITSPMGTQAVTLVLATENGAVSGTASMGGDTAPCVDPALEGDRLRWSTEITKPMKMTIKFDLVRDGDTLKGQAKAGFFVTMDVTGSRVAAS